MKFNFILVNNYKLLNIIKVVNIKEINLFNNKKKFCNLHKYQFIKKNY